MIDRRFEVDDMFWLQRSLGYENSCFVATGSPPVWDDGFWGCNPDGKTEWHMISFEELEERYRIDFRDYLPEAPTQLLKVATQDGDVIGSETIPAPEE
jgi:hypothetical protein